jgi:hypothetical protein
LCETVANIGFLYGRKSGKWVVTPELPHWITLSSYIYLMTQSTKDHIIDWIIFWVS